MKDKFVDDSEFYQECDGFFYFDPKPNSGSYSAYALRLIADRLDEMNAEWNAKIEKEMSKTTKGVEQ